MRANEIKKSIMNEALPLLPAAIAGARMAAPYIARGVSQLFGRGGAQAAPTAANVWRSGRTGAPMSPPSSGGVSGPPMAGGTPNSVLNNVKNAAPELAAATAPVGLLGAAVYADHKAAQDRAAQRRSSAQPGASTAQNQTDQMADRYGYVGSQGRTSDPRAPRSGVGGTAASASGASRNIGTQGNTAPAGTSSSVATSPAPSASADNRARISQAAQDHLNQMKQQDRERDYSDNAVRADRDLGAAMRANARSAAEKDYDDTTSRQDAEQGAIMKLAPPITTPAAPATAADQIRSTVNRLNDIDSPKEPTEPLPRIEIPREPTGANVATSIPVPPESSIQQTRLPPQSTDVEKAVIPTTGDSTVKPVTAINTAPSTEPEIQPASSFERIPPAPKIDTSPEVVPKPVSSGENPNIDPTTRAAALQSVANLSKEPNVPSGTPVSRPPITTVTAPGTPPDTSPPPEIKMTPVSGSTSAPTTSAASTIPTVTAKGTTPDTSSPPDLGKFQPVKSDTDKEIKEDPLERILRLAGRRN